MQQQELVGLLGELINLVSSDESEGYDGDDDEVADATVVCSELSTEEGRAKIQQSLRCQACGESSNGLVRRGSSGRFECRRICYRCNRLGKTVANTVKPSDKKTFKNLVEHNAKKKAAAERRLEELDTEEKREALLKTLRCLVCGQSKRTLIRKNASGYYNVKEICRGCRERKQHEWLDENEYEEEGETEEEEVELHHSSLAARERAKAFDTVEKREEVMKEIHCSQCGLNKPNLLEKNRHGYYTVRRTCRDCYRQIRKFRGAGGRSSDEVVRMHGGRLAAQERAKAFDTAEKRAHALEKIHCSVCGLSKPELLAKDSHGYYTVRHTCRNCNLKKREAREKEAVATEEKEASDESNTEVEVASTSERRELKRLRCSVCHESSVGLFYRDERGLIAVRNMCSRCVALKHDTAERVPSNWEMIDDDLAIAVDSLKRPRADETMEAEKRQKTEHPLLRPPPLPDIVSRPMPMCNFFNERGQLMCYRCWGSGAGIISTNKQTGLSTFLCNTCKWHIVREQRQIKGIY